VRRLPIDFGEKKKNWLLHHDNAPPHTSYFTRKFSTKINIAIVPDISYFSPFLRLKIKLIGRHFDTTEVTEADSQAVPNILTEQDYRDAFKKCQKRWER
jgi:hypothetical protein